MDAWNCDVSLLWRLIIVNRHKVSERSFTDKKGLLVWMWNSLDFRGSIYITLLRLGMSVCGRSEGRSRGSNPKTSPLWNRRLKFNPFGHTGLFESRLPNRPVPPILVFVRRLYCLRPKVGPATDNFVKLGNQLTSLVISSSLPISYTIFNL